MLIIDKDTSGKTFKYDLYHKGEHVLEGDGFEHVSEITLFLRKLKKALNEEASDETIQS